MVSPTKNTCHEHLTGMSATLLQRALDKQQPRMMAAVLLRSRRVQSILDGQQSFLQHCRQHVEVGLHQQCPQQHLVSKVAQQQARAQQLQQHSERLGVSACMCTKRKKHCNFRQSRLTDR